MAVSTERTVRDVLVAAIQGVASQLGFSEPGGNIRAYLIDDHQEEQLTTYLAAKVGNRSTQRAIGVQVLGSEEPWSTPQKNKRTYEVTIEFYYLKGTEGKAWNDMIDHARIVRGAISAISPDWNGTVIRVNSSSPLSRSQVEMPSVGTMLVGALRYTAEKSNADFGVE